MATQAFNFVGPQQPTQQPAAQGPLAQMALGYGGTGALPAVQQNEYLANALQQLQQSGAEASKTPLALGANLLADALLQYGRHKSNARLLQAVQAGQAAQQATASQGTGLDASGNLVPAAGAPGPAAAPPSAPPAPSGAAPGGSPLADALAPPPATPAATDHPLAAALAPLTADQVAALRSNPQAFLGIPGATITSGARSPQHNAAVGGVPTSEHIPGNGYAYDFVPPKGMTNDQAVAQIAASGIPYDQLIGEGNHIHIGWRPEGVQGRGQVRGATLPPQQPPQPQAQPQAPPQPQGPPSAPPGNPYQVASSGPTPPPPQQMQGAQPQGQQGPPTGPTATPQEAAIIRAGLQAPRGSNQWNMALQLMQEIRMRAATPMTPPKDMMWGPNGQAVPIPGTGFQDVQGAPNAYTQRAPNGEIHVTGNPAYGTVPPGTMLQGGGQVVPMGGTQPRPLTDPAERARWGISPADRNSYAIGPDGKIVKTADAPYGPHEIQSVHDNFWGSDETKKAQEAYSAFNGLTTALQSATGNNGPLDQAAIDSFLRGINPGMGARNSTVQMVMEHFGLPAELQGRVTSLVGNGFVTPQSLQQMLQITHDYALAHQQAARARSTSDARMVAPYGYGAADLAEDLPVIGPVPTVRFGVQNDNGAGNPASDSRGGPAGQGRGPTHGAGAAVQSRLQALQAEAARRAAARAQGAQ